MVTFLCQMDMDFEGKGKDAKLPWSLCGGEVQAGDVLFVPAASIIIEKAVGANNVWMRANCTMMSTHTRVALGELSTLAPLKLGHTLAVAYWRRDC